MISLKLIPSWLLISSIWHLSRVLAFQKKRWAMWMGLDEILIPFANMILNQPKSTVHFIEEMNTTNYMAVSIKRKVLNLKSDGLNRYIWAWKSFMLNLRHSYHLSQCITSHLGTFTACYRPCPVLSIVKATCWAQRNCTEHLDPKPASNSVPDWRPPTIATLRMDHCRTTIKSISKANLSLFLKWPPSGKAEEVSYLEPLAPALWDTYRLPGRFWVELKVQ